jgi:hypothetical protein
LVLFFAVAAGLLVGFLLGGSTAGFGVARFRYLPLLMVALAVQVLIFTPLMGQMAFIHRIGPYLYMISTLITLFVLFKNLHIPGLSIILIGAVLNAVVIFANGGFMPTRAELLDEAGRLENVQQSEESAASGERLTHTNSVIADDDTRLYFLGDTIAIPQRVPLSNVISIGDILIAIGAAVATARVMRLKPEPEDDARANVGEQQSVSG